MVGGTAVVVTGAVGAAIISKLLICRIYLFLKLGFCSIIVKFVVRTVSVNLSYPPGKYVNARFTTVPLKAMSD